MELCDDVCAIADNGSTQVAEDYSGSGLDTSCLFRNVSTEEQPLNEDDMSHRIFVAVMTSLLAFVILIGNGLIIVSVTVVRKLRQPANYLIVSLALSDFLVALVVLPLTITYDILGEWVFGSTLCNIHVSFDVICCTTSIMNLCMISIDRYLMITKPMTYPKRRTAKLMAFMITTAWVISCLIILPALFGFTRNVTDDPSWIKLGPTSGLQNGPVQSSLSSSSTNMSRSTFWTPCTRYPDRWHFSVDLEKEYKITKFRVEDKAISTSNFYIQAIPDAQTDLNSVETLNHSFHLDEEFELNEDLTARYIRILFNGSSEVGENVTKTTIEVYAELIHGKSCLISQEVWFTIYSTVGAFYLPLAVMLCMYWKIYVEASRFKARHRARSKSLSDQLAVPNNRLKNFPENHTLGPISTSELEILASKSYPVDVSALPVDDDFIRETNMMLAPKPNTAPTLVFDEMTSTSIDDVFESQSSSKTNGVTNLKFDDVTPDGGNHDNGLRQCSESNMYNMEKPQQIRMKSASVQYGLNGHCLTTTCNNNQLPHRGSASWCKVFQYSNSSLKSGASSLNTELHQTNGRKDFNANNRKHLRTWLKTKPSSSLFQKKPKPPFQRRSILSARRGNSISSSTSRFRRKGSLFFNPLTRRASSSTTRERLRNAKAIRTLGIIVIAFTFCWLPFFILTFIRPFVCEHPESQDCFPVWLVRLVLWLGYLNSALNPIIYVGFSSDLRETFKFLISCKCANVDRKLAQIELRQAIQSERKTSDALLMTLKVSEAV